MAGTVAVTRPVARVPDACHDQSALLMPEKMVLMLVVIPGMKAEMPTTVAAAIRPYSIAVTPSRLFASFSIF